ncbi:MAG: hypothetical protein AAGB32_03085 [Pseudomonadota bacterium]
MSQPINVNFNAIDTLRELDAGNLSLNQAAEQFSNVSGLTENAARDLIGQLDTSQFVNLNTGADILNGFLRQNSQLNLNSVTDVVDMVQALESGNFIDSVAQDFLSDVALGNLPVDIDLRGLDSLDLERLVSFDALDALQQINLGNLPIGEIDQIIEDFSNITGLAETAVEDLLGSLDVLDSLNINNLVNLETAADVLNGFIGENSFLNEANIGQVLDIVDALESGQVLQEFAQNLISDVANGVIPIDIGEALSQLDLGQFQDVLDVANVLQDLDVLNQIQGLLDLDAPELAAALLGDVASLLLSPDAIADLGVDAIAESLSEAIDSIAPGLTDALESIFGQGAVGAILGGALAGLGGECSAICSLPEVCGNCPAEITENHVEIRTHETAEFEAYRIWFVNDYFTENLQRAMGLMASQLSTTLMQQVQIIGSFFDAKHQLESQRLFQTLTAQAHKDYHPSEALCSFGTNTRYLAHSKRRSDMGKVAFSRRMMQRQMNQADGLSEDNDRSDMRSRIDDFIEKFCDERSGGRDEDGIITMAILCGGSSPDADQINADINYTQTIENKLTLDAEFATAEEGEEHTNDEESVFALSANLFAHDTMPDMDADLLSMGAGGNPTDLAMLYLDLRSMAAKRSVAQNSFAAITSMRVSGDPSAGPFLKAILAEMGVDEDQINQKLGEDPSQFAQEEVMMKLLYQDPTFYINLYDKPANIERMNTAMLALEIVQDRNIYESLLRSEATLATLIETLLLKDQRRLEGKFNRLNIADRERPW